jgi:arylsulfatase A-like enzyme
MTNYEIDARVPLIISSPQMKAAGQKTKQLVELLDLYPTLSQLANLDVPAQLEGISLTPQVKDPSAYRERPAICTHNAGNHSVCDTRWRYIVYADGAEELYDRNADPFEHTNLIADPANRETYLETIDRLSKWLPSEEAALAVGSANRILEKRDDGFYWQEKKIVPEKLVR